MPDPTESSVCPVCGSSQPFQWPGKENLCPECFGTVQRMNPGAADEFLYAVTSPDPDEDCPSVAEQLADLESRLKSAENECAVAQQDMDDARDVRDRAECKCFALDGQIAILKRLAKQASLAVAA